MESKAHSRGTYETAGHVSRMELDFLDCSDNLKASFKPEPRDRRYSALSRDKRDKLHIGVVGAGFAGLRCADVLIEEDVQVTVLEGRNRIGGRVHQVDLVGHIVDMGPNWIHGTSANPIVNLAKKTKTELCLIGDSMSVFDQYGQALDMDKSNEFFDLVWSFISDAFKCSNEDCQNIPPQKSLKDFFIQKLDENGLSKNDQMLILQIAEMWGAFIGDPWDKQSLKYFWMEECLDGENFFVASSHAAILQIVAKRALSKAEILLNTKVIAVETNGGTEGHPKVLVRTDDQTYEFDEVVITVPLGCLKRQVPAFSPPLPASVNRAIENTSYSSLEKVYITFPTAFWDSPASKFETTSPEKVASFSSFVHFLHPTYAPENPESWSLELNSLSSRKIFGRHAQPTLLLCIYGPCAKHITSLITPLSPSSAEYFKIIDNFFRPYYALLPNYVPEDPHCHPSAVLATNWQNDSLAGFGSYMNFKVSDEPSTPEAEIKLEEDIRALRLGCPERGIWLAGEHTAPFVALGTLTGAYWSGEAVGMRILRAHERVGPFEDQGSNGRTNEGSR